MTEINRKGLIKSISVEAAVTNRGHDVLSCHFGSLVQSGQSIDCVCDISVKSQPCSSVLALAVCVLDGLTVLSRAAPP